MFPGRECLFKAFEKWVSSWQKDLRGGLHLARASFDWRCPVRRVSRVFSHFMPRTQFTRAVYTSQSSSVGIEFLGLDPEGCLKGTDHLTKIEYPAPLL